MFIERLQKKRNQNQINKLGKSRLPNALNASNAFESSECHGCAEWMVE